MPTKSLLIASIVTLKLSLSGYAAIAASASQANVAAAQQLGGGKAPGITLVRGGGFGGHGFGGGFGRGWYGGYGWYGCYYPYYCY